MRLLNVGCGGCRPGKPWTNIDQLRSLLAIGTPERTNLDKETNYVDFDISFGLPFPENSFDGLYCGHVLEHFDCHGAVKVLESCLRVMKPKGIIVASVPDAEYFLSVYEQDIPENAVALFGEPISADEPWQKSFFDYALFQNGHHQLLTRHSLHCLLLKAGFPWIIEARSQSTYLMDGLDTLKEICKLANREKFSATLLASKTIPSLLSGVK